MFNWLNRFQSLGALVMRLVLGIIMVRQRLMKAARALAEKGEAPPGRDAEAQSVRSVAIVLPRELPFKEGAREALYAQEGTAHSTI